MRILLTVLCVGIWGSIAAAQPQSDEKNQATPPGVQAARFCPITRDSNSRRGGPDRLTLNRVARLLKARKAAPRRRCSLRLAARRKPLWILVHPVPNSEADAVRGCDALTTMPPHRSPAAGIFILA